MPSLHTSRNFIIHSIPYLAEIECIKTTNIEECNTPAVDILKLLAVSNSFMNGSLAPEVFQNFTIVVEDFAFLNIVSKFSSILQFTNKLSLRKMLHHEMHPYFHFENKEWKVVKTQAMVPFLPAQFLTRLITTTRYFSRQLTSFDFYSINDCYRAVFRHCLPRLRALRHLKIKFPIRHCVSDDRSRDLPHEDFPHDRKDHELYPETIVNTNVYDPFNYPLSLEEAENDPIVSVAADYKCRRRVKHCISHGRKYRMLTEAEIVIGLKNLRNLSSLELVFSRELKRGTLAKIWKANPMSHLKKLSLTQFAHSIDDPITSATYPYYHYEMDDFRHVLNLEPISSFQPNLESLTLRRMIGTVWEGLCRPYSPPLDYARMRSLKELSLFGYLDSSAPITGSLTTAIIGDDASRSQFCPQLVKLSLGNFTVLYELEDDSAVLEPEDVNQFLRSIASKEVTEIDLLMSPMSSEEAMKLDEVLNDETLEIIAKRFPLLRSFRMFLSTMMTDQSIRLLGESFTDLTCLNITSADAICPRAAVDGHSINDEAMAFLFDPEKCTSCCYATLEEVTINARWFEGKGWFGEDPLVPHKQYFRVRKLDLSGMSDLVLRDVDHFGGLPQILYAFSDCLEELHLPYYRFDELRDFDTIHQMNLGNISSQREMLDLRITRLRSLFCSPTRSKEFSVSDYTSVSDILIEALRMYELIEKVDGGEKKQRTRRY